MNAGRDSYADGWSSFRRTESSLRKLHFSVFEPPGSIGSNCLLVGRVSDSHTDTPDSFIFHQKMCLCTQYFLHLAPHFE